MQRTPDQPPTALHTSTYHNLRPKTGANPTHTSIQKFLYVKDKLAKAPHAPHTPETNTP